MQIKEFSLTLDLVRPIPYEPFEVTEGDTGNFLRVTLQNDGEPVLLNDCWLVVVYGSSTGFACQDTTSGVMVGDTAGQFSLLLDPQNYGPGNVSVDVQLYSGPNRRVLVTSTTFDFRCRRSLLSEGILRANMAYPPLLAAAQEALDAAEAARGLAALVENSLGEQNVQPNWAETDYTSDAFIRNKPYIPAVPGDIDAEPQKLVFTDVAAPPALFVQTDELEDYPFSAALPLTNVTASMIPAVLFAPADAASGKYAPFATAGAGTVTVYATEPPESALTVPTVVCWQA